MAKRRGGKFLRSHTTLIDLAARVADIAVRLECVTGVLPGIIQNGQGVAGGVQRVKLAKENGCILLTVRQSRSVQEMRIYSADGQTTMLALARALRNDDIAICFKK